MKFRSSFTDQQLDLELHNLQLQEVPVPEDIAAFFDEIYDDPKQETAEKKAVEKPGPDATSSLSFHLNEAGIPVFTLLLSPSAPKCPNSDNLSSTTTMKRPKWRDSQTGAQTKPKTQKRAPRKRKEPFNLQKIIKSFQLQHSRRIC